MSPPSSLSDSAYAPPTHSAAPPEPDDGSGAIPAGFGIRFGARLLDIFAGFVVAILIGFPTGILIVMMERAGTVAPGWQSRMGGISITGFALGFVGSISYHTLTESIGGASLGKLACGLRVRAARLGPDGTLLGVRRCGLRAALVRSLAVSVDALFFGAVAYTQMSDSRARQRLGDKWGDTVVVRAESVAPCGTHPVLGNLAGLGVWGALIALDLILRVL